MKKWIIILLMMLIMVQLSTAIDECKPVTLTKDVPCMIISSWSYSNCTTTQARIYNETPALVSLPNFTDYTPTVLCNFTWNISTKGTYIWNTTSGDIGRIIIESEEQNMIIALSLFGIFFIGLGIYIIYKGRSNKNGQMDD